jgi:hypothetical protein
LRRLQNGRNEARTVGADSDKAVQDDNTTFSRRNVFKGAAGIAAVGVAGGAVLMESSPALAASGKASVATATTTEQGAVAPAVVNLSDAPTIALDASLGNDYRVTIESSCAMGNPVNAADGQKITLQVTQGGSGSSTIAWGSAYEFATGLPQPTLSTAAGQTDLFAFIYNAGMSKWLCAAFVQGFSTPSTSPPPSGTYRLFPSTNGPSSPVSYSGPYMAGVLFEVTAGGTWFEGYWWWVCPSGQSTAAQQFALWQVSNVGTGVLIANTSMTSQALTPGQWNYVQLGTPIALAPGACYNACTGLSGSFPVTENQFGSGEPYSAGIINGPLTAFSDQSGSVPAPFSMSQGVFGVSGSDPTSLMPTDGNSSDNLWMDLQVGTTAPTGATYRLWPNYPVPSGLVSGGSEGGYTLATEFRLSQSCALDKIWFYSPSGAAQLPTRCAIWDVATRAEVSGTDNSSPSWSGSAGSGWVSCQYTGVTLPAGDYKVAVVNGGNVNWFQFTTGYWTSGPGTNGITAGPLNAPNDSAATSPGQAIFNSGTWGYPDTYGTAGNGENYWVDVEVTPS